MGGQLRGERLRQEIGLRELARRVGVSPSMISQIERGKAMPSVGTLYAIVTELGLSLDELFRDKEGDPDQANGNWVAAQGGKRLRARADALEIVVRSGDRQTLELASGVRWERLTADTDSEVDFLFVVYEVGGASCAEGALVRHAGKEFGHVLTGKLGVTIGFEELKLEGGDSISFHSTTPHRLWNDGAEPVEALWFVVGREGDARVKFGRGSAN